MQDARGSVLVVDDDLAIGLVLVGLLRQAGLDARHVASGSAALDALDATRVDVMLTDLQMPGMDGLALVRAATRRVPGLPVVLLTAHGTVPVAVEAMKAGCADFLTKPFDRDEVLFTIRKALASSSAADARPPEQPERHGHPTLLGNSAAMRACVALVERAAQSNATVLLRGETGTGKEVAARAIHAASPRSRGPFVAVHCGALPETLLESELFGYEKGAFTGALARKPGRVELASGGTLLLDEIGDVSLAVQVKLLRLLQEREITRVGGTRAEKVDVRFLAATHRDLEAMVRAGTFRQDLFYRLDVIPIVMPSLLERPEDVPLLAQNFCAELGAQNGRPRLRLDEGALQALTAYAWPGNVRQLQHFVERLAVFADADVITARDVERELGRAAPVRDSDPPRAGTLDSHRARAERDAMHEALQRAGGNRTQAARLLGVSRRTLYNKLAEFELEKA